MFEGPGQWSALQMNPGLVMRPDFEVPTKAVIDYIFQREDVDQDRLALYGPSLGSLLVTRVAAHEKRVRACGFTWRGFEKCPSLVQLDSGA